MFGECQWVSIAILVGYWAFPFVFLMSRWTKRIVPSLVFFAVTAYGGEFGPMLTDPLFDL